MSKTTLHVSTSHHQMWNGPKRYIRIFLYDTMAEMHLWITPFDAACLACFEPAPIRESYNLSENRFEDITDPHWAGVMRLNRENLNYEILVHESIHAATTIYRMDIKEQVNLGYGCHQNEEWFAYLTGEISYKVITKLQDIV